MIYHYLVFTCLVVYKLICKGNKSGHGSMFGMPPLQIVFVKKKIQKSMHHKAKIKNLFVSCIQVTVRKCCDWKYFLCNLATSFLKFILVTGNHDRNSDTVRNWLTLLYMIKICCSTWAGTNICVK